MGSGDGFFLELLKRKTKNLIGIELSKLNCKILNKKKIKYHNCPLEEYDLKNQNKFDLITFNWTLCNTSNPLELIQISSKKLRKNGYIVVSESSRVLVPYKKPLQLFIPKTDPAHHPYYFSKNSLVNLFLLNQIEPIYITKYIDSDYLVIIGKKTKKNLNNKIKLDDYKKVKKFFYDWYIDSKKYKNELY